MTVEQMQTLVAAIVAGGGTVSSIAGHEVE